MNMDKTHPETWPCHDCEKNVPVPFTYCVPATPAESRTMERGLFLERPPLCYDCWVKRTT